MMMREAGGASRDAKQLLRMLEDFLQRESDQWKPHSYSNQVGMVTSGQRNETIQWFSQLNKHFGFYPETFFLSTTMLDKVLQAVKVRPRYLKIIGITCFYLAAKTLEEDEVVPSTLRIAQQSGCGCSVAEILRMERKVLDILSWNLRMVTPLDFLHVLHASLLTTVPTLLDGYVGMTPGRQLSQLTRSLEQLVTSGHSTAFQPSVLALAVISTELQRFLPAWFTVTQIMQLHVQVSDDELIRCMDLLAMLQTPAPPPSNKYKKSLTHGTPTKKRRVADRSRERDGCQDDDMYEGIKRLYTEAEADAVVMVPATTCGVAHRYEDLGVTPIALLPALAN